MSNIPIRIAAAAALCALPLVGYAQHGAEPSTAGPQAAPTTTMGTAGRADTGKAANTNAKASGLATGMTVKDNTGAAIGQIGDITADASGKSMATIKMGADAFQVGASDLTVKGGAATINLTKAQIDAMIHKPTS
jgi:hypothetical protein